MSKKAHVAVSREENVIVLRCYLQNPSNWSCVLEEVRENMHLLSSNARELYKSGNLPWEKVRRRMADQVSKWTNADPEKIDDGEMKALVREVQKIRQKYSEKKAPEKRKEDGNLPKSKKARREQDDRQAFVSINSDVSDSETANSATPNVTYSPEPSTSQGAASSSSEGTRAPSSNTKLAREANELYIDFARNKLPRLSNMMEKCMEKYLNQ